MATKLDLSSLPEPGERFNLLGMLGEGTYGEVYEAVDTTNNKHVAVKIVDCLEENVAEIEEEHVALATHWIHPNIPHFEGLYLRRGTESEEDDQIWLVMELCDGGSISQLVQLLRHHRLKNLGEDEIAYVLKEIVNVLVYLHEQGTFHRDVKGSNILLTSEGDVKLIDYGIACRTSSAFDRRQTCVGTPYWMAPEVIMCDANNTLEYDSRCDVWSLGITAIELAEGSAPLSSIHPMRALFQIPRNPPPTLKDELAWSDDFADFVKECLIKDFDERPFMRELVEHPFLQRVPNNPSYIKTRIMRSQRALRDVALKALREDDDDLNDNTYRLSTVGVARAPLMAEAAARLMEATIRHGRIKMTRLDRGQLILHDDLSALPLDDQASLAETENILVQNLKKRFSIDLVYTYVGEVLLAINPMRDLKLVAPRELYKYRNRSRFDNPPHVFAMANHAYHSMLCANQNQVFLVSGERLSGKSFSAEHIFRMLVYLGRVPFRNLEDKLLNVPGIVAPFVNTDHTLATSVLELFFTRVGKVTGAKVHILTLMQHAFLGKANNFRAVAMIVNGLASEDRLEERFSDRKVPDCILTYLASKEEVGQVLQVFNDFRLACISLGFRSGDIDNVFNVVLAALCLSNLEFNEINEDNEMKCEIKDKSLLNDTANLLGFSDKTLLLLLTESSSEIRGEKVIRMNTSKECNATRDALASTLYSRLVDYVVHVVNSLLSISLSVYGESNSIAVVDNSACMQPLNDNGLEQLCANIVAEQVEHFYRQLQFVWEREEHLSEGIAYLDLGLNSADDRVALDALLDRRQGLLVLLDEESRFAAGTDSSLMSKLAENKNVEVAEHNVFVVRHFDEQSVYYDLSGWTDRNRNFVAPEIVEAFTSQSFGKEALKALFVAPLNKFGRLAPNEYYEKQCFHQSQSQQTSSTYFRYALQHLMQRFVLNGQQHFVKCLVPNEKKPDKLDEKVELDENTLARQLRYMRIIPLMRSKQQGFSTRLSFGTFLKRYCFLAFDFDERVVATREKCQLLLLRLRMDNYALGKTKVFLRHYHVEYLGKLYEAQMRRIVRVQSMVRRWLAKLRAQREKWAVARKLFLMKRFVFRWRTRARKAAMMDNNIRHNSVMVDKSMINRLNQGDLHELMVSDNRLFEPGKEHGAAVEIQRHVRGFLVRRNVVNADMEGLVHKVVQVGERQSTLEVEEMKENLVDEGLSANDAAKLIQCVFRNKKKRRNDNNVGNKEMTKEEIIEENLSNNNLEEQKQVESTLKSLMQQSHLNNVKLHTFLRRNKDSVHLDHVAVVAQQPLISNAIDINIDDNCDNNYENSEEKENKNGVQPPRRFSMTPFYNDPGPSESWDAALISFAEKNLRIKKSKNKGYKAAGNAGNRIVTPAQPALALAPIVKPGEGRRSSLVSGRPLFESAPSAPPRRGAPSKTVIGNNNGSSVIDHLHSLRRNGEESEDESGPFDFRALLRKTNFAPTESLRRRKTAKPRLVPNVVLDEQIVTEL